MAVERWRLCWVDVPVAAALLRELAERALAARRRGLRLRLDAAPDDVWVVLVLAGLA